MILISGLIIVIGIAGCFKEIVETREPLPELVWPDPPETARIHFVNSISTPEHLNIRASLSERMFKFIKGEIRTPMNNPYGLFVDAEPMDYLWMQKTDFSLLIISVTACMYMTNKIIIIISFHRMKNYFYHR
jgi:hypothetical protein